MQAFTPTTLKTNKTNYRRNLAGGNRLGEKGKSGASYEPTVQER